MFQGVFDKLRVFVIIQSGTQQTVLPHKALVVYPAHDLTHMVCIYPHDHIVLVFEMIVESGLRHVTVIRDLGYGYLVDTLVRGKLQKGFGKDIFCVFSLHFVSP